MKFYHCLQEVPLSPPASNNANGSNTTVAAAADQETEGAKEVKVKMAVDKLKESRQSDDESKSMPTEGDVREEPRYRSKSEHRTESGGEKSKDRDRERDRERPKARDRDRGRDSDRERERDEAERDRDKVKDRGHRSRERTKDSGCFIYSVWGIDIDYVSDFDYCLAHDFL